MSGYEILDDAPAAPSGFEILPEPSADRSYQGHMLPFSRDAKGALHLDTDAGIVGAIKRSFMLPGDVYTGKVNPNSDQGIDRAAEMALTFNPANPGVTAGDKIIPGVAKAMKPAKVKPPTAEELFGASDDAYKAARGLGVDYNPAAVAELATKLKQSLEQDGFGSTVAKQTHELLDKLTTPPEGAVAVPFGGLEAARQNFRKLTGNFNKPVDQGAASDAIRGIDEFITGPPEGSVLAGPASAASELIAKARGNYAAGKRTEAITGSEARYGLEDRADFNAAAANSGKNGDNAIRQQAKSLLLNRKASAGFNPDEVAALEGVVNGGFTQNRLRDVGNMLGGGGGLGSIVASMAGGAAGSLGGPVLTAAGVALPPAIGLSARQAANKMSRSALEQVAEMTSKRSPLYEEMKAAAPDVVKDPARRSALIRLLMADKGGQMPDNIDALARLLSEAK